MKQETLEEELLQQIKFCLICKNDYQAIRLIQKYGFQKQERMYSEEEFKETVYHMVGVLAHANNMTFNGAILDELFNKFKK